MEKSREKRRFRDRKWNQEISFVQVKFEMVRITIAARNTYWKVICAWHSSEHFTCVVSFKLISSTYQLLEIDIIITPILYMKKLSHGEANYPGPYNIVSRIGVQRQPLIITIPYLHIDNKKANEYMCLGGLQRRQKIYVLPRDCK